MRSKRMRGYGSWSIGWKEAERRPFRNSGNNAEPTGGKIFLCLLSALIIFVSLKVAAETGPLAILFGIAFIVGMFKK